jgi:hypothetical protein
MFPLDVRLTSKAQQWVKVGGKNEGVLLPGDFVARDEGNRVPLTMTTTGVEKSYFY